jgi:hypothetical protein
VLLGCCTALLVVLCLRHRLTCRDRLSGPRVDRSVNGFLKPSHAHTLRIATTRRAPRTGSITLPTDLIPMFSPIHAARTYGAIYSMSTGLPFSTTSPSPPPRWPSYATHLSPAAQARRRLCSLESAITSGREGVIPSPHRPPTSRS